MKVRELIGILENLNPEADVEVSLDRNRVPVSGYGWYTESDCGGKESATALILEVAEDSENGKCESSCA